jgi:predicted ATP-grasp superfamily ATP-dependent carboligase
MAADLFADTDLAAIAECTRIDNYPQGLVGWLKSLSPRPAAWLYTGALENHPDLVDELATLAPLWGNSGDVLRRVRSPQLLSNALRSAGLHFPDISFAASDVPRDGSWLLKSGRGASGSGVEVWRGQSATKNSFLQQRVSGAPCSATFVATGGRTRLLGVAQQLIGEKFLSAREFQFCGAIAPHFVTKVILDGIYSIGNALMARFELRGAFGVDLMIDGEQVWTIEVNPRYPSSAEVVELARGVSVLAAHGISCGSSTLSRKLSGVADACVGKAVLFARESVTVDRSLGLTTNDNFQDSTWTSFADVPRVGARIERGHPIVTLLARGATSDEVAACLKARVAIVEKQLYA